MPPLRFLNLVALALVAIVALSSLPVPVNALVADRAQVARHVHGHNAVAKRKRDSSGQCQPSSSSPTPTPTPTDTPVPSATTTTSSSPAASPSTPASSNGSNGQPKWGLGWGYDSTYLGNFANFANVGFIYDWSSNIPAEAWNYPKLQRMPMLWGPSHTTSFYDTVHAGYGQYVLGPNEPNELHQSNIKASDAYGLWMEYINPLASQGYILVSPACTDDDAGLQWYQEFFGLCNQPGSGCIVHILAFHSYVTNASHLIDYATNLHNTYGLDVMVTEFADQDYSGGPQADQNALWDYAGKVKDFVNNTPWIKGAFPFGLVSPSDLTNTDINVNPLNGLIDWSGNPTPLAEFYFNP